MTAALPATPASPAPPATLGRYRIVRELGRGAQGAVYLAEDSELGRQVAIKTLGRGRDPAREATLLAEARTTAQLTHPNIVTLYDAFDDHGVRCVVLEYVPGDTLEHLIRRDGRLPIPRAIALIEQVLEGLAYAHERGVVHRDIKPANILIDASGAARVMDFGIAAAPGSADNMAAGTPKYMAPEAFDGRTIARTADVFSVGMTFYETLAGRAAVDGRNAFEVLHKIANQPFAPPSSINAEVDEALDQIVMRALAKDPSARYADAHDMLQALAALRSPGTPADDAEQAAGGSGSTVDFLLNRMRHKSSFPAMSQTISAINKVTAAKSQSVQELSGVLLKDFALTNKLLRLVNSSGYVQFGGTISTISRAVMILGFDAVRDLAITLVMFEHLQNKGQATKLRDDVISALLTGIITRRIGRTAGIRDQEEGFICGVFRNLGRLLIGFYLFDESLEIGRRVQQTGVDDATAAKAVLGVTYDDVGVAVARSWNLPNNIIAAMQRVPEGKLGKPKTPDERLRIVAALAEAVNAATASGTPAARAARLHECTIRFGTALDIDDKQLSAVATDSVAELLADSAALLGDSRTSRFCQTLRATSGNAAPDPAQHDNALETAIEQTSRLGSPTASGEFPVDPAQVLAAGIQDITDSLVGEFNLSDLLRIILETMYRGMGFGRVMLFMRDARVPTMTVRFGFGADVDNFVSRLSLPLGTAQDVFSVVLAKNVDIFITDVHADNIRARIPPWFQKSTLGATFVLLPIVIEQKAIGLFYADKAGAGDLQIEPREMNLLKTLRNQAVLALRQRR